jgi:hypothetical protein
VALAVALPAPNAASPSGIQTASGDQQEEVVLDLRTDLEVKLEGPEPITRATGVRIEHRSLYPQSGGNTDFDATSVKLWPETGPGPLRRRKGSHRAGRRARDGRRGDAKTPRAAGGPPQIGCHDQPGYSVSSADNRLTEER